MVTDHRFGWLDWSLLAAYAAVLLAIGFRLSRQQRTTQDYFLGRHKARAFLAGISIFAAHFSVITYLGTTGEYVQYGPVLAFLPNLLIIPFLYLVGGWLLIPAILRLPITSAYELLEARLGRGVRQAGSLTYVLTRLVWMSLILFVSSTVLVHVLGCDPGRGRLIILTMGLVTMTYTLLGGIRTVMVTEVIQFFMLLSGALVTLITVTWRLGGVSAWWPAHREAHWLAQPFFSLDPHVRANVVGAALSWFCVALCTVGSDQGAIQRFLTTRDPRSARRAYLLSISTIASIAILLGLVGASVMGFFKAHPEAVPANLSFARNGDAFFPLYIGRFLPSGISGILVASLLAAGMACLSSGINATTTVITKDFIENTEAGRRRPEEARLRLSRLLALPIGAAVMGGGILLGLVHGNIFEVMTKTADLLSCPTLSLFLLAIFVKFSTPFGAIMGFLYGATAAVLVGYWDALTGGPKLTFLWIAPIALAVSLAAGCGFSLLRTRGRGAGSLAGYAAGSLVPLILTVAWLVG